MKKNFAVLIALFVSFVACTQSVSVIDLNFLGKDHKIDSITVQGKTYIALDKVQEIQSSFAKNTLAEVNKKSIQSFASNVYKIAFVITTEALDTSNVEIASSLNTYCKLGESVNAISLKNKVYEYGWEKPNFNAFSCSVVATGSDDFAVTIFGDSGDGTIWYSINGAAAQKR